MERTSPPGTRLNHWLSRCHWPVVLLIAFFLLAGLDIWVRHYIERPGLAVRNEGHEPMAVPYMLRQIELDKAIKIAWAGSSLMQGSNCTSPTTTCAYLNQIALQKQGYDAHVYNLSHAGNLVADNFCLSHAAINRGADVMVFELIFGLFIGRGFGFQSAKQEFIWYVHDMPDFTRVRRQLLKMPDQVWYKAYAGLWLNRHWALLQHKSLLLQNFTGRYEGLSTQIGDRAMMAGGLTPRRHGDDVFNKYHIVHNADYRWKDLEENFIEAGTKQFQFKTSHLKLTPTDPKIRMLARICREGVVNKVPMLFYFAPTNREMLDLYKIMNWDVYNEYRNLVTDVLETSGCEALDLTDAVDSRHFVDTQHLNMKGHRQMAKAITPTLIEKIEQRRAMQ